MTDMYLVRTLSLAVLALGLAACSGDRQLMPLDSGIETWAADLADRGPDSMERCQDPAGDYDGDQLSNSQEGCLLPRDTDGDMVPDWQDFDSDGDRIIDSIEAGDKDGQGKCAHTKAPNNRWPCDTDGDKSPDHLDTDSDGDKLGDGDEDYNGDGQVGCCLITCNKPDNHWQRKSCTPTKAGCGKGQTCVKGKCFPPLAFDCSRGETSNKLQDTFGDGMYDGARGTFVCRDATKEDGRGRKAVQVRYNSAGLWRVALEKSTVYTELKVAGAAVKEAAAVLDLPASDQGVAGFVVSLASAKDVRAEAAGVLDRLGKALGGQLQVVASGTRGWTHERLPVVRSTTLSLSLTTPASVSSVRDQVVAAILGKGLSSLGNRPQPMAGSHGQQIIRYSVIKRYAFKKDSSHNLVLDAHGNPVDSGDKNQWWLHVMGAVAARAHYDAPTRETGYMVDDLAGATAISHSNDTVSNFCDAITVPRLPAADIIWVVQESCPWSGPGTSTAINPAGLFTRAKATGLDLRVGVTGMSDPAGAHKKTVGKLCSKASTSAKDDGGVDRFLQPGEASTFSACLKNPPGLDGASGAFGLANVQQAVKRHLPRAPNKADRVRTGAALAVIVITDEVPGSLQKILGPGGAKTCALEIGTSSMVDAALKPHKDLLSGVSDKEGEARLDVIGGICGGSACSAEVAHGYGDLSWRQGGHVMGVCQKSLDRSLLEVLRGVEGLASPVVLERKPISTSLSVTVGHKLVPRGRYKGFDFRPDHNSLVFSGVSYHKGSEVIISYKEWRRQMGP